MPIGNGNVTPGGDEQLPQKEVANPRLPDIHDPFISEEEMPDRATFRMEIPDSVPENFDELPEEEKARIRARLRFRGIRLRDDLRDLNAPVSPETLDI